MAYFYNKPIGTHHEYDSADENRWETRLRYVVKVLSKEDQRQ